MELIDFADYCVIERDLLDESGIPVQDEYDEPIRDTIYKGRCLYQEGGINTFGIISRRPTLYLPETVVKVEINDVVKITTESGRQVESLVNIPRDVKLRRFNYLNITKLELKQAMGD